MLKSCKNKSAGSFEIPPLASLMHISQQSIGGQTANQATTNISIACLDQQVNRFSTSQAKKSTATAINYGRVDISSLSITR